MAALTFYGLSSCDTCRAAFKALASAGREIDRIDVRRDGVPEAALADWMARLGVKALLNTRSATWRALDADERIGSETPEGALALLVRHPTLMKRPVIVDGRAVHVGWSADVRRALERRGRQIGEGPACPGAKRGARR